MADKLKMMFLALLLMLPGVQMILSGEISAREGKGLTPGVTSFPFAEPYVPWLGWLFVLVGIYFFFRTLYLWIRK
jgi:hypothetical protein